MASEAFALETSLIRRKNLEFEVLCLLDDEPGLSQREIARQLQVSLGRINSCVKGLAERGTVAHVRFRSGDQRLLHAYELTAVGQVQRQSLAEGYLERKLAEFDRLKAQIEGLRQVMQAGGKLPS